MYELIAHFDECIIVGIAPPIFMAIQIFIVNLWRLDHEQFGIKRAF